MSTPPLISIVSAAYRVARYLPEFIASIEAQTVAPSVIEMIVVDDGSDDDTLRMLQEWAARSSLDVRVLSQENQGQGPARNRGMSEARGTWVTFPDPDDVLEPDYLERVLAFLERHPDADLVATNRILWQESTGEQSDHPLRRHFMAGDRLRDLERQPAWFHGSAPAAFFRLDRIREYGLEFDHRIRPNFEDGHFTCRYLLTLDSAPQVGFIKSARYLYRKRADQSSTLQSGRSRATRYTDVVRYGYLDALATARRRHSRVPHWLQNFLIYELSYYFAAEDSAASATAPPHVRDEFHQLAAQVIGQLEPAVVEDFDIAPLRPHTRDVLRSAYRTASWHSATVQVAHRDRDQGLVELVYRFAGEMPDERYEARSLEVEPAYAKTRSLTFHGRTLLKERRVWLPARFARLILDGRPMELDYGEARGHRRVHPVTTARYFDPQPEDEPEVRRTRELAARARTKRRFADAWVFVDRLHNADDSAEHLFDYVRAHHPQINAFFVIEEGTPDWKRLRKAHRRRVIPYDTDDWRSLMLNAKHLISSHADAAIALPPSLRDFRPWPWRFTFLQHGVIKDDLSGWLNGRPLDLFVTSTQAEYDSVVAENTSYRFTDREVILSGLPRFDLLHEQGLRFGPAQRDLILVAPTWRSWLVPKLEESSQRRGVLDNVHESQFFTEWLSVLTSPELREVAEQHGAKVALLPHPNLAASLTGVQLPDHVELLDYEATPDIRELFARARVLVTDYSSTAFNAAYIDRPVVYFQFDADRMFGGDHVGTDGYFDYERDGFGPVAHNAREAVAHAVEAARSAQPPTVYQARINETFPLRDGNCRKRVVAAIRRSTKPWPKSAPLPPQEN